LQRPLRLRRNSDFARLHAQGRRWQHPALTINIAPNHLSHNRYGFVTSRRVGKAVVRNRIRRRLRACIREYHAQLEAGYDIVFIARPPCVKLDYNGLCTAVHGLLEQANIIRKENT